MPRRRIAILNGPNLNLLGVREPGIYGTQDFESFLHSLRQKYSECAISYAQSNVEGELINHLHAFGDDHDGIIINPAGYSHTSVALADAIAAIRVPMVEVHISNIHAREPFRHQSLTAASCKGVISGLGLHGYELALQYLLTD